MTVASKSPRPDLTQGFRNREIRRFFREEMMLTEDAYHLIHPTSKVDKMMKNPIKISMNNYAQLPASKKQMCELRLLLVGKGLTVLPWPKVQPSKSTCFWFRSGACQSSERGTQFSGPTISLSECATSSPLMGRLLTWEFPDMWQAAIF